MTEGPKSSLAIDRSNHRLPAPREGRWFAKPHSVRWTFRQLPSYFLVLWLPFYFHDWIEKLLSVSFGRWPLYLWGAGTTIYLLLWAGRLVQETAARMRSKRDRAFSDRPEGIEEFAVEAVFAADQRYLGIDRGVVWFENGLMNFHGAATSFVLAAEDLVSLDDAKAYKELPRDSVRLRTRRRSAFVRLRPLVGPGMFEFNPRLRKFIEAEEAVHAPRQWPPLELYSAD